MPVNEPMEWNEAEALRASIDLQERLRAELGDRLRTEAQELLDAASKTSERPLRHAMLLRAHSLLRVEEAHSMEPASYASDGKPAVQGGHDIEQISSSRTPAGERPARVVKPIDGNGRKPRERDSGDSVARFRP